MKKVSLLITFQLLIINVFGQSWGVVGNQMFGASWGTLRELEIINDVPHLIYIDYDSWEIRLTKFENNSWTEPANGVIAEEGGGDYRSVVDSDNNLYVAFNDADHSSDITVKKWTGTNWILVGDAGFGVDAADSYPMQIGVLSDNSIVMAYTRTNTWMGGFGYLDVMRFNGTTWEYLGQDVTGIPVRFATLGIMSNDDIYLSYLTDGNDSKVVKYNGTSWDIQSTIFDSDTCYRTSMTVGPNDEIIAWRTNYDIIGTEFFKANNDVWESIPNPNHLDAMDVDVLYDNWAIEYNKADSSWYAGFTISPFYGSYFKKFNGTDWDEVGDSIIWNPGGFEYSDLEFNSLGVPFYTSEHHFLMSWGEPMNDVATNDNLSEISIYPNPSSDFISVTFNGSAAELNILDLNGKSLISRTVLSGEQIDVSGFKSGIYFLKLNDSTQKLIIK